MYTNDERFAILHTPGSNTWTLQIKFVQRRDHGMYECQVGRFCLSSPHRCRSTSPSKAADRLSPCFSFGHKTQSPAKYRSSAAEWIAHSIVIPEIGNLNCQSIGFDSPPNQSYAELRENLQFMPVIKFGCGRKRAIHYTTLRHHEITTEKILDVQWLSKIRVEYIANKHPKISSWENHPQCHLTKTGVLFGLARQTILCGKYVWMSVRLISVNKNPFQDLSHTKTQHNSSPSLGP